MSQKDTSSNATCLYFTFFFKQNAKKVQTKQLHPPVLPISLVYLLSLGGLSLLINCLDKRFFQI